MSDLPSKWAVADASWGEGKRHLWCPDTESFEFHATEQDAIKDAHGRIQEGTKGVVIMEVKRLLIPRPVEYDALPSTQYGDSDG